MSIKNFHPLSYKQHELCFEERTLASIAAQYGTPFYLYSEKTLIHNYKRFSEAAQQMAQSLKLPAPLICFALKANPNLKLLSCLAKQGAGADIVSGGEMRRALEAGIPASRIVFSGVGKTQVEIEEALVAGIYSFNVESLEELEFINQLAQAKNKTARVTLRLNPQVQAQTHKHISTGHKTHKFGMLKEDVMAAVKDARYWQATKLVGLSMHIGSQLLDLSATALAVKELAHCALEIGKPIEFLDVGGGLGVDYAPEDRERLSTPEQYMEIVGNELQTHYYSKLPVGSSRPHVTFEPGRVISARAGVFVMRVIRTKESAENRFVIVDGGMNDFVRSSLYGAYHEILPAQKSEQNLKSDIVGPICETTDCFGTGRMLPKLKSGDLLCVADTGAYGFSMASQYNMRSLPKEVVLTLEGQLQS